MFNLGIFRCVRSVVAVIFGLIVFVGQSQAGEGAFGWIYSLDLQPKGTWEFEQRLQRNKDQASGNYDVWTSRSALEYGLTDNLQLGAYVHNYYANINQNYTNPEACEVRGTCTSGYPVPSNHPAGKRYQKGGVDGVSLEAIYRLTNPVIHPVGIGFYIEPKFGRLKNEIETRLLLQSNFIDDRLIVASNLVFANENLKFLGQGEVPESMFDVLLGVSYRFAPKWFAGIEGRWHNDYSSYFLKNQTQQAFFIGPNLHYAEKSWWFTAAMRYQPKGGKCMGAGTAECSDGRVWDSHSKTEVIFKFGIPLN